MTSPDPLPTVAHLNGGVLRPPGGVAAGYGADELVCHVLLVDTGARRVLVDGGIGLHDVADSDARLGEDFCALASPVLDERLTVCRQLGALGIDPATVTDVVLTHPDRDHVGVVADLPGVRVHAHPDVPSLVRSPIGPRDVERIRTAQWGEPVVWADPPSPAPSWFGFRSWSLDRLGGHLRLVDLPGHATGHVGVAVRRPHGWLLHAGDAYFHPAEIRGGEVPPALQAFEAMVQQDEDERIRTQRRLAALPAEVRTICSHDPGELPGPVAARPT